MSGNTYIECVCGCGLLEVRNFSFQINWTQRNLRLLLSPTWQISGMVWENHLWIPLPYAAELQSNLRAILSEFTGLFKQSKVHKKFHRDVLSKGRFPEKNKCGLSHAALVASANPLGRQGLCDWPWALCCGHSCGSSQAGSWSLGSSCRWRCCCSFSLPTSGSNWWRVSVSHAGRGGKSFLISHLWNRPMQGQCFLGGLEHPSLICRYIRSAPQDSFTVWMWPSLILSGVGIALQAPKARCGDPLTAPLTGSHTVTQQFSCVIGCLCLSGHQFTSIKTFFMLCFLYLTNMYTRLWVCTHISFSATEF